MYFLLFFFFVICNTGFTQDLFSAENSKKFARYLFSTQQYKLAANEYERILNITPTDTSMFEGLIKTYRLGDICQTSFKNLEVLNVKKFFSNNQIASEYLKLSLACNCCNHENYFAEAISKVDSKSRVFYKLGFFVFNEEKDSIISFANINQKLIESEYPTVYSGIYALEQFRGKKPAVAATMSALIPGSGKAYTGYWGDAVMSFIFVSSNAWLSYKGFNRKGINSVNGWIFGSISMGFYFGNIWGSARAAKTYNKLEYEILYNETQNSIYNHF